LGIRRIDLEPACVNLSQRKGLPWRLFQFGAQDWMDGNYRNGDDYSGVAGQAWDRGSEAAMRFTRQQG
jgi:hypothetical protein